MSTQTFHWDAIMWIRDVGQLSTEARPADRVEDPDAPMRVPGFIVSPSRAATYAYAALWVMTLGITLWMLGLPALSASAKRLVHGVGQIGLVASAGLLIVAYITSRRHRARALVELRPASAEPATTDSITALHNDARGAIAWVVFERSPDRSVLAAAADLGVRCVVRARQGFVDLPKPSAEVGAEAAAPVDVIEDEAHSASRNSSTTG